uniref:Uncharacterized protein n=1 Tax=Populus trichocarpa TaxID=3694 RepID=A0A3N7FSL3_POPTR
MAPLSIAMTSIYMSTATAVFVTPLLSLLLMVYSITQIVVAPIAAGLLVNRLFPHLSTAIHPFLPPLSVLVTACCVEAPPAINVDPVMSPFGITSFLHFIYQHLLLVIFLLVLSSPRHLT